MRVELHASAGETCPTCKAFPLLAVTRSFGAAPELLARDLLPKARWWQPLRKRTLSKLAAHFEGLEAELLRLSDYPFADVPRS